MTPESKSSTTGYRIGPLWRQPIIDESPGRGDYRASAEADMISNAGHVVATDCPIMRTPDRRERVLEIAPNGGYLKPLRWKAGGQRDSASLTCSRQNVPMVHLNSKKRTEKGNCVRICVGDMFR